MFLPIATSSQLKSFQSDLLDIKTVAFGIISQVAKDATSLFRIRDQDIMMSDKSSAYLVTSYASCRGGQSLSGLPLLIIGDPLVYCIRPVVTSALHKSGLSPKTYIFAKPSLLFKSSLQSSKFALPELSARRTDIKAP